MGILQERILECHTLLQAEEAVPGPSVFPSREPGVSGDFWGSQEGCQGPSRPSGRNRGQGASRAAPGKSGLHARGEGERVLALV